MSRDIVIHGIRNCDTMKKARVWLETHGIAHRFHDYRTEGVSAGALAAWSRQVGWETLLNRAGTTFRKLPDARRANLDEAKAIALMVEQPAMIRRPVLDIAGKLVVGFKPDVYAKAFGAT